MWRAGWLGAAFLVIGCGSPGGGGGGGWVGDVPPGGAGGSGGPTIVIPPGPPVEYEAFCDRFAERACALGAPCGCLEAMGATDAMCRIYTRGECAEDYEEPVEAGRRAFVAAAAGQCLAAIELIMADCDLEDPDADLYEAACDPVTVGIRAAGEGCESDRDCVVGLECYGDTCEDMPAAGQACLDGTYCAEDLYCAERGTCATRHRAGGPCPEGGVACEGDLVCLISTETCAPLPGPGQTCDDAHGVCQGDYYCSDADTCAALPVAGQACSDTGVCKGPAYCDDAADLCRARAPDGAACAESRECTSGECDDGTCAPDPKDACPFL